MHAEISAVGTRHRRMTALEIHHIARADDAWTRALYNMALHAEHINGPLGDLSSFWSNPIKSIKAFISHPAKTIAHDITAKKIVKTVKTVAPIAAGAAALYFGVPYLASGLGAAGSAIDSAASTVGSYITSAIPGLATVGKTAYNWWSTQAHNAGNYLSQLSSVPAVQTAASRGGVGVDQLLSYLQSQSGAIPTSVAAGGQGALAQWLAEQQLTQQGIGLQSQASQALLAQRLAAEQATMGASQAGYLPSNANQPGAAPVVPAPTTDWSKMALVGIAGTGLLITAMNSRNQA